MRVAICDDISAEQLRLRDAVSEWANAKKINVEILCYQDAEQFIFASQGISFDLIFLDIQLGEMSGMDLAKHIRKTDTNVLIVFVTSFAQFAVSGYDVNAFHFLVKPILQAQLIPLLDRAYSICYSGKHGFLLVSNKLGQFKLPIGDIFYIEMFSHRAAIHTDAEVFELRKTLTEFEKLLPTHFMRCRRSIIINILKVQSVYKDSISLSSGVDLPVSRKCSKLVHDAFVRFFGGA